MAQSKWWIKCILHYTIHGTRVYFGRADGHHVQRSARVNRSRRSSCSSSWRRRHAVRTGSTTITSTQILTFLFQFQRMVQLVLLNWFYGWLPQFPFALLLSDNNHAAGGTIARPQSEQRLTAAECVIEPIYEVSRTQRITYVGIGLPMVGICFE